MIPFEPGKAIVIGGIEWMVERGEMELRNDYSRMYNGELVPQPGVLRVHLTLVAGMEQFRESKPSLEVLRRRFEGEGP